MTVHYLASSDWQHITSVDASNFETEVMHSDRMVLVDFYSAWCVRCKPFTKTLAEFAEEHEHHFKVVKVDIDRDEVLWEQCGCKTIPALAAIKDGEVIGVTAGNLSRREVAAFASKAMEWHERCDTADFDLACALGAA